ncbi:NAD-dependent epimerase/dehydratase family protein [Glaciihabitans sp. GrIS 2.15]|uniref:NAD-dependent epimerase/dehydratase family protein n=1 Tax=Glaciihabitans sp. GrIS 2.15 TaxID=3071710 RepID=UPI002E09A206|nr:UDP-glucose 4-epimerase [Glaciihabitans sp. GrIS 2.15]
MTSRVLLVGASGPLGRAVAGELTARGQEVTRTSRSDAAADGSARLDATDTPQVRQVLDRVRPSAVVYLARPGLDGAGDVAARVDCDVDSLRAFAAECARYGVQRVIFASSAAVYGTSSPSPRSETDAVVGDSPYAALKLRSEAVLAEAAVPGGFSAISLRIFNVYGAGFSSSLVNRLVWGQGTPPLVHDTADFVRDYIHASDVARAFALGLGAPGAHSGILNVGTGLGTTNHALLKLCPQAVYEASGEPELVSFSISDISHIRSLWGFEPRVTLESAIREPDRFFA